MPLSEWAKAYNELLKETAKAIFFGGAERVDSLLFV
jgi:hypothetical protein